MADSETMQEVVRGGQRADTVLTVRRADSVLAVQPHARRRPRPGATRLLLLFLVLSASVLLAASPCAELSSIGVREEFEECAAGDDGAVACVPGCIVSVPGCMDSRKTNYDPAANTDDGTCDDNPCDTAANDCDVNARCGHIGPAAFVCVCKAELGYVGDGRTCIQPMYACTYEQAANYDARCALAVGACIEDGSCQFLVAGCMDPGADNYMPAAGVDDGSCYVYGCTHPGADNYNPAATTDCVDWGDGTSCVARNDSCVITGCQDPRADNYNADATVDTTGQSACVYTLRGCTYNNSLNFNATANTDDGSCIPIVEGCTHPNATNFEPGANLDDGTCQWIPCDAEEDDCHQNATCTHMGPQMHDCRCENGFVGNGSHCDVVMLGCTDTSAFNYNNSANVDDGGCLAIALGCKDEDAYNFDPSANTGDGGCIARICGCTDSRAVNFERDANTDDGSCDIDPCSSGVHSCADEAICSYIPRGHGSSVRSQWNSAWTACQRVPVPTEPDLCSLVAAEMRLCPVLDNSSSSWNASSSCVATGYCPEEPGDPLASSACEYLGGASQFVPCGYRQCVPRELADQCLPGTYSCRCRGNDIGNGHQCEPRQIGCTDRLAFNYDPGANVDNGTCVAVVSGCTNSMARNYNVLANTDDGSCVVHPCNSTLHGCSEHARCTIISPSEHACVCFEGYGGNGTTCIMVTGCTYQSADNYNPNATQDDGSCRFTIDGCTDPNATNFVAEVGANRDDGSCVYVRRGCMYSGAWNYDPTANVDDRSCIAVPVFGCRDPAASNFNPDANVNSTCIPTVFGCADAAAYNANPLANTDDGSCNYDACAGGTHDCHSLAVCNYTAPLEFNCTCHPGHIGNGTWCARIQNGCTVADAWNFDELANVDDGSCISRVFGCTDPSMFNYDSLANTDDGGCVPIAFGCITDTALNFAPGANTNTSDCINPDRAVVKVYVGSHGHQMGWTFQSKTHHINLSLPYDALTGKEYLTSFDGYGYFQILEMPAGEWAFHGTDSGGNGWPGSQVRIDHPAESCTAILVADEAHAELCGEWQIGQTVASCTGITVLGDSTETPVCKHSAGTELVEVNFGSRAGKVDFDSAVSISFHVPCSHHEHCARFEYCDSGNRCKSCGQIGNSSGCSARNDSLAIPVVDSILERSRRAQLPPVGTGEVWFTSECPRKCLPILGCTDFRAINYNRSHPANTEDGSCMIVGCQHTRARNYDAEATVDNSSSCIIVGCMDLTAFNYDPVATEDDNVSCVAVVPGCTNHIAVNFDTTANTDDGSCIINPCTAPGYYTDCHSNATCEHVGPELYTCNCAHGFVGNGLECQEDSASLQDPDVLSPTPLAGPTTGGTVVTVPLSSLDWAATDLEYETAIVPGLSAAYRAPHNICHEGILDVAAGTLDDGSMLSASFDRSMDCTRLLRAPPGKVIRVTITEWHVAGSDACAALSPQLFHNCNGSCVAHGSCSMKSNGDFLRLYAGNDTQQPIAAFGADDKIEFGSLYSPGNEILVHFYSDSTVASCVGSSRCSWSLEWSFVHDMQAMPENYTVPRHTMISISSAMNLSNAEWFDRQQSAHVRVPTNLQVGTTRLRCWFAETAVRAYLFINSQLQCTSPPGNTFMGPSRLYVGYVGLAGHVTRIPWVRTNMTFQYLRAAILENVQSPSAYHQWLNPHSHQPEFGLIGFGPSTGGSRTLLRGQHFANISTLTCRWTPFYLGADSPVVVTSAEHVSDTLIFCTSPTISHGREAMFQLDVSLNGQQFTHQHVVYLFYFPMALIGVSPFRAPALGGFLPAYMKPPSVRRFVSVGTEVTSLPHDSLSCTPLGPGLVSCGTSTCVPRTACPNHDASGWNENLTHISARAQCRWRRSLSPTESADWRQGVDLVSLVHTCDQDGCFDVEEGTNGLRTGCYSSVQALGRASFCDPDADCCFEELVVAAEVATDTGSSDDIVCRVASQMKPGTYAFDVTKNGQDFSGAPHTFEFNEDSLVHVAAVAEYNAWDQCEITLYGRGFLNGSAAGMYSSNGLVLNTSVVEYHSPWRMSFVAGCVVGNFTAPLPVAVTTNGQQYHTSTVRVARDNRVFGPTETLHFGPAWHHTYFVDDVAAQIDVVLIQSFIESPVSVAGRSSILEVRMYESFGGFVSAGFNFTSSLTSPGCTAENEESRENTCQSTVPCTSSTPGRYTTSFTPTVSGVYTLALTRYGVCVPLSFFCTVVFLLRACSCEILIVGARR